MKTIRDAYNKFYETYLDLYNNHLESNSIGIKIHLGRHCVDFQEYWKGSLSWYNEETIESCISLVNKIYRDCCRLSGKKKFDCLFSRLNAHTNPKLNRIIYFKSNIPNISKLY